MVHRGLLVLIAAVAGLLGAAVAASAAISLRHDAQRAGMRVGMAAEPRYLDDAGFAPLLARQANVVTFENAAKWAAVHPSRHRYDFRAADRLARWARDHGMTMRGHNLLWHLNNPAWLEALQPTRAEAIALLREHITTVVRHFRTRFPGLVRQWDVVNEGIGNDARRRQNVWQRWIGDDYIAIAFRAARAAAGPHVRLYYNDYVDEGIMRAAELTSPQPVAVALPGAAGSLSCAAVPKCRAVQQLVRGLVRRHVPIDGVGFQAHMAGDDPSDYRALTAWVSPLGLRWAITEADYPIGAGADPAARARQAAAFRGAARACVRDRACDTFVAWGLTDRYTWWTGISGGLLPDALLFDADGRAKPALAAVHEELARRR